MVDYSKLTDAELKAARKVADKAHLAASRTKSALDHEYYRRKAETCEQCKVGKLLPKRGGGVACDSKECDYWFCY